MVKVEVVVVILQVVVVVAVFLEVEEVIWNDVMLVDILGLEVGYCFILLVDKGQGGELFKCIKGICKKFVQEVGFLLLLIYICDNLELKLLVYCIILKGVEVGNGEVYVGQYLVINLGMVMGLLLGMMIFDFVFGLLVVWIDSSLCEQVFIMGYIVVDVGIVVVMYLNYFIIMYVVELLGCQEVQSLLDYLVKEVFKLVEDLVFKMLLLGMLQKVLQNFLLEGVYICDMCIIIEILVEYVVCIQDLIDLMVIVWIVLGCVIV